MTFPRFWVQVFELKSVFGFSCSKNGPKLFPGHLHVCMKACKNMLPFFCLGPHPNAHVVLSANQSYYPGPVRCKRRLVTDRKSPIVGVGKTS